jgi:hypothetical protein
MSRELKFHFVIRGCRVEIIYAAESVLFLGAICVRRVLGSKGCAALSLEYVFVPGGRRFLLDGGEVFARISIIII